MEKIFFLIGILFSHAVYATSFEISCTKVGGDLAGYCIHKPVPLENQDVIYHFHGSGGSEFMWQENYYPEQLRTYWKENGLKIPTVVSISFGPFWLLSEKNSSEVSGLLEILMKTVIPEIEGQLPQQGRRLAVGESMGGFNTLQLALKTNFFQKTAVLCAPLADTITPFSSAEEISRFVKASYAWGYYHKWNPELVPDRVQSSLEMARVFFPTPEAWLDADPIQFAKHITTTAQLPEIYLAVGMYDEYAIYEGNERLAHLLQAKNAKIEWRPQWGGHCAIDIPSLAQFLVK